MQTRSGRLFAQYPYRQESVFANPDPPGSFAVNGVGNKLRLYAIDVTGATNVLDEPIDNAVPVRKRLVADLADFGLSTVDNVEGMTWGLACALASGRCSWSAMTTSPRTRSPR